MTNNFGVIPGAGRGMGLDIAKCSGPRTSGLDHINENG
jgi:hypothetical protein